MPVVRPFRALRYDAEAVGDLGLVVAPPYDAIGADEHRALLARSPFNVVRLDSPSGEFDDLDPDDKYRRAGRLLSRWRGDGIFRRDSRPSIYVYEQQVQQPGGGDVDVRRGFFARVGLEPSGRGALPHEESMLESQADRYRLLRATNVNTSPIVAVYQDQGGLAARLLDGVAAEAPDVDVADMAGNRHRLWVLTAGTDGRAEQLAELAARSPLTITDGHDRHGAALRLQAEQRVGGPSEPDPDAASEFALMLLVGGDAMAQEMPHIYPKAITGLVINPLEG